MFDTPDSRMNRRSFVRFAVGGVTVGAVALAAACRPSAPTAPTSSAASATGATGAGPTTAPAQQSRAKGGNLLVGTSAGNVPIPSTPPDQGAEGSRFVGFSIYNALVQLNVEQGDTSPIPSPALATKWGVGSDQLTWTFDLRKGVKFHDGTDFNAEAVEFQFKRLLQKDFEFFDVVSSSASISNLGTIDTFRAVDTYTFELKTKFPDSFIPWELHTTMMPSPTAVKKYGNQDYVNHATGTGPFLMSKYVDGQVMELVPNPAYWKGPPKLDKMTVLPMPDPNARLAAFSSGEINWAEVPPPDSLAQLKGAGNQVLLKQYPHAIILALNVATEPFSNPKARQALQYAIDKDKMCNSLLNGCGAPAYQWMYKGHPWWNTEFGDRYHFDPARAKQLLAEAGYPGGFQITVPYPTSGSGNMWPPQMMELIQSNFKAIGVEMTTVPMEWNTIVSIYRAGFGSPDNTKYHGMYFSPNTSAPSTFLNFTQGRIQPNGCCNVFGFTSPDVEQTIAAAQAQFDPPQEDALLAQSMGQIAEGSPAIYVCHDLNLRVLSPKVQGFVQPQSWYAEFMNVTVG
jgi:peptide/nickel transport system substrate-binding protein